MDSAVKRVEENGDVFDGLLDDNGNRKYGTLVVKVDGLRYIGDFRNNVPCGTGTVIYSNKTRFEGTHNCFKFEKGELIFEDGERHEGTWIDNCPTQDGLRKYRDGRRSQQGMMVIPTGKRSSRYAVFFIVNNGVRVAEIWQGTSNGTVRESITLIPQLTLQYEESLIRACSSGNILNASKVLKQHSILAQYALDSSENKCAPCLVVAAANGYVDIVKLLLMNGADPRSTDADMHNSFHAAAFFSHVNVLKVLCDLVTSSESAKQAVNSRSESDETPLQMAVASYRQSVPGADECVRLLIAIGADPGGLEPTMLVTDPTSALFNSLLIVIPPPTEVTLQNYLREWHSRSDQNS